jgi:hypothetical protein
MNIGTAIAQLVLPQVEPLTQPEVLARFEMHLWPTPSSARVPIEFSSIFAARRCALLRTTTHYSHRGFASFIQHSLADGCCWPEYVVL